MTSPLQRITEALDTAQQPWTREQAREAPEEADEWEWRDVRGYVAAATGQGSEEA